MATTKHFGYYVFGKDMNNVNLTTLKKNGITDIFLNYYAFTAHGESKVLTWIKNAKTNNINVHIWMQCFYNGEWINPVTNKTIISSKIKEAKKYANMKNVAGVHLDYLRYPGNAYKTQGGAEAITNFVKQVKNAIPKGIILSCAVMPESDDKHYYGQDIESLGKICDVVIPMQYKGNYSSGTSWLNSTTKEFTKKATIWSALQTYKSDDDETQLSAKELLTDAKTCTSAGAKGAILFRYGISPNVNFTSLQPQTTKAAETEKISTKDIKTMATTLYKYIEKNKKFPSTVKVNNKKYTYGQVAYILAYAVNNIKKSCEVFTVKPAPKPKGDAVDEKITMDDYQDIAKRVANYIKKNKECPNYAHTKKSKKKLRPKVFTFMFARIIVYYYKYNKMTPTAKTKGTFYNTTTTKSTTTTKTTTTTTKASTSTSKASSTTTNFKKYGHSTEHCCDDMGQNNGYFCGCHSLQEVFRNLTGKVVPQSTIADVCGTTTSGTDHDGLNTCVAWFSKKYGFNLTVEWKNFSDIGWSGVKKIINSNNQDCVIHNLYRDQYGHYEVINKVYSDYCDVQNSLGDRCSSGCYYGYVEERYHSTFESYMSGISQKSVMIITRK